jgi:AbrB family looped-hinge helix DNA binding protein
VDYQNLVVLLILKSNTSKMDSAVTVKGQATIPKAIRDHLGIRAGDRVKFFVHPDGSVVLLPKIPVSALRGMIKSQHPHPVSTDQMEEAVAEGVANRNPRQQQP